MFIVKKINIITIIFCVLFPVICIGEASTEEMSQEELIKTLSIDSYDHVTYINGSSYMFYAQNNPVFNKTIISDHYTVGSTSCSAAALANALINCISYDDVDLIQSLCPKDICIDTHCIQSNKGLKSSLKFKIEDKCDYFRYLPICFLNYVAGNNTSGLSGHMNTGYYRKILDTYSVNYKTSKDNKECLNEIESNNAIVITCTGGKSSPIANKGGHYFVLVALDDQYLYCLDSFVRDKYKYDKKGIIEIVESGVIRVKKENIKYLCLTGTKFILYRKADRTEWSNDMLGEIFNKSNNFIN